MLLTANYRSRKLIYLQTATWSSKVSVTSKIKTFFLFLFCFDLIFDKMNTMRIVPLAKLSHVADPRHWPTLRPLKKRKKEKDKKQNN